MINDIISCSIIGGIGDVIFGLEGIKEIKTNMCSDGAKTKCYLITHAAGAIELVRSNPYVDHVSVIEFCNDLSHFNVLKKRIKVEKNYLGDAKVFCYTINPDIFTPTKTQKKTKIILKTYKNPLIILHPCGSKFSRYFLGSVRNVSTKELDVSVWQRIIQELYIIYDHPSIMLIGSKSDYDMLYAIKGYSDLVHVFAGTLSVPECVTMIQQAQIVIGVDSFAKSISLASKIPTIVFVNDHEDKFRDEVFLIPYKEKSYACILHDANIMSIDDIITHIRTFIKRGMV